MRNQHDALGFIECVLTYPVVFSRVQSLAAGDVAGLIALGAELGYGFDHQDLMHVLDSLLAPDLPDHAKRKTLSEANDWTQVLAVWRIAYDFAA